MHARVLVRALGVTAQRPSGLTVGDLVGLLRLAHGEDKVAAPQPTDLWRRPAGWRRQEPQLLAPGRADDTAPRPGVPDSWRRGGGGATAPTCGASRADANGATTPTRGTDRANEQEPRCVTRACAWWVQECGARNPNWWRLPGG